MITNGKEYQFYRVVNKQPLESELVFKVNLIEDDVFINNYEDFAYITKDAVENNGLYDFWKRKSALKSDYLAHLIYSKEVMKLMQKAIKKRKGVYFEENIVRDALKEVITNSIETDLDYITNLHKHV
jgi:L-lactate utilization protein LutB